MIKLSIVFFFIFSSCSNAMPLRRKGVIYNSKDEKIELEEIIAKMSDEKDLTIKEITVEKSTLNDVVEYLGNAKINKFNSGNASEFYTSVCYINPNIIGLEFSSGVLGGGKYITRIDVFKPLKKNKRGCFINKSLEVEIGTKRGIRIGLTKEKVKKLLGKPSIKYSSSNWEYYYVDKEESSKCKGGFDVTGSYNLIFEGNSIKSFYITKATSC
ncbi:outer membrane protein assembly factor BamE [Bacteriovorax sp. Seq25_V]|uniref:outer membrane protein assembly factor BamE domain-containing protein n=1 Tax=Bacteriovorax sp. Seq25_V TaxID=1201288 RepID=UPI000389F9D0|nr:outer membrane protein assembly factor BamE [Bacteriovorax sp. Seq25_V]EQC44370.1 SmpA/OmlA family protein [Bacteriovorax sp. Seq25_V]